MPYYRVTLSALLEQKANVVVRASNPSEAEKFARNQLNEAGITWEDYGYYGDIGDAIIITSCEEL